MDPEDARRIYKKIANIKKQNERNKNHTFNQIIVMKSNFYILSVSFAKLVTK